MNLAHKRHFDSCLMFALRERPHRCQLEMCSPTKPAPGQSHTWQWVHRCSLALTVEFQPQLGPQIHAAPQGRGKWGCTQSFAPGWERSCHWPCCHSRDCSVEQTYSRAAKHLPYMQNPLGCKISAFWKRHKVFLALWHARGTTKTYAAALCAVTASAGN